MRGARSILWSPPEHERANEDIVTIDSTTLKMWRLAEGGAISVRHWIVRLLVA